MSVKTEQRTGDVAKQRYVGSFQSAKAARKYWLILVALIVAGALFAFGLLAYDNPMDFGTRKWWLIAQRRADAVTAMAIVAVCQAVATVAFHTVTNNRILTPSIMGFESLYAAINTATIFFLGATGLTEARNMGTFLFQMAVMIVLSLILYSWLLTNRSNNMHAMLLVGVVIGGGLGSLSTLMQRMLTPSEFDVLTARLFGSVNNAETEYYPIAIPLVIAATALLFFNSRRLNVLSLGREAATNLGVNHKFNAIFTLILVSVLMATTTSLVGPMTFLGFLVATLAYQFAETYDHRYLFPMAIATAFAVLTGAYFLMQHVFYAQGVVSIIIELVGGSVFLIVILRKGRL
ncbi:TPA: iron chelate uptake ABC transporter family permease subunit [Corynebacterium striatum]|uniref:iron chelate uptake ABC transporter family permease subunit n=1 Tax=Corynebacterium TaxID=1716 RepID=UPI0008A49C73|nr:MULTISPECIES: iron chelate uptake ABC transporter family permease subunit [unclassified Corynebacterium]MCK6160555.1 iron chelate uptake ABC transporter family permease subunit [Corynebacterium simulans]HAT1152399.1 iron chelate uptake ABC transporter family permease subunit [Corynebacterium striatum]OFL97010.1 iron ABC transporter permease [Corynebacterium sp. HMSC071F07]OFT32476.1 iron ABC transporter permease [Corynebacterium sp. HMSC08C04]OHO67149.1 iron ABC transporter permease [Coryne